ncbi:MAG: NAD/NADP octopine/nopaline dehydrogenase family protein [Clostridia bacterium]|nr:NAD/NADP octopine/nopaline dehydrogenase family protein [Clostridia bacterium]MBQ7174833.1 NAD/NADP octopine/nopaline dehydrogenase family protein [Lachnospiraceae bacterium]
MKFTVLGAGNTGHAMAAYLRSQGAEVCLWTRNPEKAEAIRNGGITSTGSVEGTWKLACTTDFAEAVAFGDVLMIMTTAGVHKEIFEKLKPVLKAGQKIVVTNANWGAFEGMTTLGGLLEEKDITLAETGSQLFVASSKEYGRVHYSLKSNILLAATDPARSGALVEELKPYLPALKPDDSILRTTLSSTNPVIHVPITILNTARTENAEPYKFYGNGISPMTVDYIVKIDAERVQVAKALGLEIPDILTGINSFWEIKHDNLFDALHENEVYQRAMGPTSFHFRYITEDIPYGVAPVGKIGRLYGVPTPYTDALVTFASCLTGENYMDEGVEFTKEDLDRLIKA